MEKKCHFFLTLFSNLLFTEGRRDRMERSVLMQGTKPKSTIFFKSLTIYKARREMQASCTSATSNTYYLCNFKVLHQEYIIKLVLCQEYIIKLNNFLQSMRFTCSYKEKINTFFPPQEAGSQTFKLISFQYNKCPVH